MPLGDNTPESRAAPMGSGWWAECRVRVVIAVAVLLVIVSVHVGSQLQFSGLSCVPLLI